MAEDGKPSHTQSSKPAVPGLHHNRLSWIGNGIAFLALANIGFLFLIGYISNSSSPYLGIFTWVIFPAFLIFGILLLILGMLLERRRRRRMGYAQIAPYPRLDFNSPALRRNSLVIAVAVLFFVILSAVGSYQAYQASESVSFCGTTCHTPMHPEFTAFQLSAHSRMRCVDCHVGSGAGWYVRSKLNGAHQLYAVAFNSYARPIATPIPNLRPARETCEQCHWPERYIGTQMKVFTHFSVDEQSTVRQVRLLLKTGGGAIYGGLGSGIHWHMNIANKVTYIATDPQRQVIPWVRVEDRQGHVTEYRAKDSNLTPDKIASAPKRLMDCIDCHSRPSHVYVPPDQSLDLALLAGRIDRSLPNVKNIAATALTGKYNTTPEALNSIEHEMDEAYRTKYTQVYGERKAVISQAIAETKAIFQRTIFPEMKVDWRTHPNNIGHLYYPGCFRCHDGEHVSADGKVVSKDCETCHTVLAQEEGRSSDPLTAKGLEFKHPIDLGDLKGVACTDCHSGGVGP